MNKRLPGIVLTVLCFIAGGMYMMRHGASFGVSENKADEMIREVDGAPAADVTAAFPSEAPEPVNINTADAAALEKLPGIGPAKAAAVLAYRKSHGFFRVPEELMKVPGIKEGTYRKLKDLVTVGELPQIGSGEGWPGLALPQASEDLLLPLLRGRDGGLSTAAQESGP